MLVTFLVLIALFSGPSTSHDPAGPDGTLALQRFLAASGHRVLSSTEPPQRGTFVLLADLRTPGEIEPVLEWVRGGGRLVVADPASSVSASLAVGPIDRIGGIFGTVELAPECPGGGFDGVRRLVARVTDLGLRSGDPHGIACFPGHAGALAVVVPHGAGSVVLLGGMSPLTNDLLRRADNAAFALALVLPGQPVVFGPAVPPGGQAGTANVRPGGIWGLLPARAKAALVGLGLAAVAFALFRGRRLGRPRPDEPVSSIPASELVQATAGLYRTGRKAGFAGRVMREATCARLARRLGLPRDTEPESVAAAAARTSSSEEGALRHALAGPDPAGDEELIALGRELEEIRRKLEEVPR
jgi:hypothetical protein